MSAPAPVPFWDRLDWSAPWLRPYRATGQGVLARLQQGGGLPEALSAAATAGAPRFVPQAALPAGTAYERFVQASGSVPLRENLHDFLNGLVWLHFPTSKARLSARHAQGLAQQPPGAPRGALRDALTLFDENGALLLAPRFMWDALRARDWRGLFVTQRAAWAHARLLLFGHGLLEQLAAPRKPLTAHVLPAPEALDSIAQIDRWLADAIDAQDWRAKPFAPLPVLGVPGWWTGNVDESFYDDPAVFRHASRSHIPKQRTLPGAA